MHTIFVQCVEIQKVSQKRLQFLILNMDYYDDNVGVVTEWNGKFLDF